MTTMAVIVSKLLLTLAALPSLLVVAENVADVDYVSRSEATLHDSLQQAEDTIAVTESCSEGLRQVFEEKGTLLDNLIFSIHHNGDAEACRSAPFDLQAFQKALATMEDDACKDMNKFQLESFLTRFLSSILAQDSCTSPDDEMGGLLSFCDMGEDRTPILLDHDDLVPVPEGTLPCRFHTREGVRIVSFDQLAEFAHNASKCEEETCTNQRVDLHLYAVPAGRVFMFAPAYIGEVFELPHIETANGKPVSLQVLSVSPRIFDIFNFFSKDESTELVDHALAETAEDFRIKRSTTGTTEKAVYSMRTSENGFDTYSPMAQVVKRRCMSVLGYDEYLEGHTDGLQILRYNTTTAYIPHMDNLKDKSGKERHDYDSAHKGGNRYATILLYMSDLEEGDGGETVFPGAWPPDVAEEDRVPIEKAVQDLRASDQGGVLKQNSWEERMAAECRTRLAVRPNAARAVLFYSQLPDGRQDPNSKHGGCPVLNEEKQKWAANLWVWNTPREGFEGSPVNPNYNGKKDDQAEKQLKATFINSGDDPQYKDAELWWNKSKQWGKLGHGDPPLAANTFEGHKWQVKVNGEFVKEWVIGPEAKQKFEL